MNQNKMLHIDYHNVSGRYIWYVGRITCISTSNLGDVYDIDGGYVRKIQSGVAYEINGGKYENYISKYSFDGGLHWRWGSVVCGSSGQDTSSKVSRILYYLLQYFSISSCISNDLAPG